MEDGDPPLPGEDVSEADWPAFIRRRKLERGHLLVVDLRHLTPRELEDRAGQCLTWFQRNHEIHEKVLVLATGTTSDGRSQSAMRRMAIPFQGRFECCAVAELSEFQRMLVNSVNLFLAMPFKPFGTYTDAIKYLVEKS